MTRGTCLRALFIILILIAVIAPAAADGSGRHVRGRIAPDLDESIHKHSSGDLVRLVLNLDSSASQRMVADRVKALGGEVRGAFLHLRQMAVEIPAGQVEGLAGVQGIDYIAPDRPVTSLASQLETTTGASQVYSVSGPDWSLLSTGSLLSGVNGNGVGVAVIDSGIESEETDLRDSGLRRTVLSFDFTGSGVTDDPYGHGTHVAGIIAGNGYSSLKAGFDYAGIAPAANLLNLRVLDEHGHGNISNVVAAIDQAVGSKLFFNVRVLNLSLAAPPVDSYLDDPLCHAVDRAVQAGLVVVVAAGNFGLDQNGQQVYGGITSPGICPAAITVGASGTHGTAVRSDDTVARFSSRGPTRSHSLDPVTGADVYDNLPKPELVAPGIRIVSLESPGNAIVTAHPELDVNIGNVNVRSRYMILSGTSMSAGVVSGAAALMFQANPSLTPSLVKAILMYTAQIMEGPDLFQQGAGMLNIEGAVRVAASMSRSAGSKLVGQQLTILGSPRPQTTVAGETFPWSQGVVWNHAWVTGAALLDVQQSAYAQSLIWGFRDASWSTGVASYDGLYSDGYVVFGKSGQWAYVTWDQGTLSSSGMLYYTQLYASGVVWQNSLMCADFYSLDPSSLIWGFSRASYDLSLIWGYMGFDSSLIWGFGAY